MRFVGRLILFLVQNNDYLGQQIEFRAAGGIRTMEIEPSSEKRCFLSGQSPKFCPAGTSTSIAPPIDAR
jgi:hypothetical protein